MHTSSSSSKEKNKLSTIEQNKLPWMKGRQDCTGTNAAGCFPRYLQVKLIRIDLSSVKKENRAKISP
jgi:hypothetical protein